MHSSATELSLPKDIDEEGQVFVELGTVCHVCTLFSNYEDALQKMKNELFSKIN